MPAVYLDCNATTPVDPEVEREFLFHLRTGFGNAGSRTHEYGTRAKRAVERARDQVAAVVKARRDEVIFTSGATESNNLAILGLREHGERTGRRHVVSTADLQHPRIDLLSVSGHKIHAPKGIGALVLRRRGYDRPPLTPLMFGGGQERGLRPGTLPVALIAALGKAAELCVRDHAEREAQWRALQARALAAFAEVGGVPTGDPGQALPNTLNVAVPGLDSEAVMVALKETVAISNGSACTSQHYTPSHVLTAMGLPGDHVQGALRLSWCHLTPDVPWERVIQILRALR